MQNLYSFKIRTFCNFALPIVLILQLLLAGSVLNDSLNNIVLENSYEDSSLVLSLCIEDLEDEESKFHSDSWNICYLNNFYTLSSFTNPIKEYFSSLNHSRSPPLS